MKQYAITMRFTEKEGQNLKDAAELKSLSENNLLRMLIREKLNDICEKGYSSLKVELSGEKRKEELKSKILRLNEIDYEVLQRICREMDMKPSGFISHYIFPKVEEICIKGGRNT